MSDVEVTVSDDEPVTEITSDNGSSDAAEAHAERARDAEEDSKENAAESEEHAEEANVAAELSESAAQISANAAGMAVTAADRAESVLNGFLDTLDQFTQRMSSALNPPSPDATEEILSIEKAPEVEPDTAPPTTHWYRRNWRNR